ncbi:hypothetical protein [Nocardia xishanensis]|uniref:hypothetical protein n=1 Tax=Nocardia xishanensis TaxID=238964 RepID=UPI0008337221|nr:hypothetical protein [Nocardia xishanensis]
MNTIVVVGVIVFVAITVGVLVGVLRKPNSSGQLTVAAIQARLADEGNGQSTHTEPPQAEEFASAKAAAADPETPGKP